MAHTMIQEWYIGHICSWNWMLIDRTIWRTRIWRTRRPSSTTLEDSNIFIQTAPTTPSCCRTRRYCPWNTICLKGEWRRQFTSGPWNLRLTETADDTTNLPPVWNNIIKERLTVNGAGTTTGGWGGGGSCLRNFVTVPVRLHRLEIPSYWQRLQLQLKALVNVKSFILCYTVTTCD